jgi:NADPH-dependent glutamate synthase beta subunit-like oxidoreductase
VAEISIKPRCVSDARLAPYLERYDRRIETTPPGICPIAVQLSLLQAGLSQTCGKCVPCRDGIPRLATMLRRVLDCQADEDELERMRSLATVVRDTSDCAIGYEAAQALLDGMDEFADEYASHVHAHSCLAGTGQTVPCETGCPAHVNVPGYIALVANGDCAGAVAMVRKDNPFPTACALVCEHPCEIHCRRQLIDAPINIRGIKKYAVDNARADTVPVPERAADTGRRIAVVGGGPSGMTCAYFLALMGHRVTVFEARSQLGGMMRYGIPAYRFPRERLDEDLRAILSTGAIEVRTDCTVDAGEMARIAQEFDASYISIGAHTGKSLRLEHEDAQGVSSAVALLRAIGDGKYPDYTGQRVIVVGGGNVAMDCARTAVRANAESVTVVYRRRMEDMTALPSEVQSALAEGVEMTMLSSPAGIEVDKEGRVSALLVQPQMVGPVKAGRPSPIDANKPRQRIPADVILIAVGQDIVSKPFEEFGIAANRHRLGADEFLHALDADGNAIKGVFAGGECTTGPATVIRAIGAGKVAARNIDEYLGFHHTLDCGVHTPDPAPNMRTPTGRVNLAERPARERKRDFLGVECEMSTEEALQECSRCLRCDHYGCGSTEGGRVQYA